MVDNDLASGLYRCDTPEYLTEQAPLGKRSELLATLFAARVRDSPVWIKDIIGTKSTPEWHTAGVGNTATVFGDLVASRLASDRSAWKDIARFSYLGR